MLMIAHREVIFPKTVCIEWTNSFRCKNIWMEDRVPRPDGFSSALPVARGTGERLLAVRAPDPVLVLGRVLRATRWIHRDRALLCAQPESPNRPWRQARDRCAPLSNLRRRRWEPGDGGRETARSGGSIGAVSCTRACKWHRRRATSGSWPAESASCLSWRGRAAPSNPRRQTSLPQRSPA